ncbi:hypothetical protein ACCS93_36040 [Rhizobium ruizarguesonis]
MASNVECQDRTYPRTNSIALAINHMMMFGIGEEIAAQHARHKAGNPKPNKKEITHRLYLSVGDA